MAFNALRSDSETLGAIGKEFGASDVFVGRSDILIADQCDLRGRIVASLRLYYVLMVT